LAAEEQIACPKCSRRFPLCEGITRQAIERHAEAHERALAQSRRALEAELAAEAKRRAEGEFESRFRLLNETLADKEASLSKFRNEELGLRRRLREMEEAKKNLELDYTRKLDAERKLIEAQARSAAGED